MREGAAPKRCGAAGAEEEEEAAVDDATPKPLIEPKPLHGATLLPPLLPPLPNIGD